MSPTLTLSSIGKDGMTGLLPKVFIEGNTVTRVSLTKKYVDCINYSSRPLSSFSGCLIYDRNDFVITNGIYHTKSEPVFTINSRVRIAETNSEVIDEIKREIVNLSRHLMTKNLLIVYDDYSVLVYDRYESGRVMKFPLEAELGDLKVSRVPKPVVLPSSHTVKELEISDYRIEFESEVIKFNIYSSNGYAELVYNPNGSTANMKIVSENGKGNEVKLIPNSYYLISHTFIPKEINENQPAVPFLSRY